MDFDFAAFLVLATAVTGAIALLDKIVLAPRRRKRAEEPAQGPAAALAAKPPVVIEYARSFFPVFLIVLLLRSFLVEPFRIPSGSMMPTLLDGDFILVNKFSYGIRLPVLDTKVIDVDDPARGDVLVFRYPRDPSIDYIKRVVGLPGDRVAYYDKMIHINGKPIAQHLLGHYSASGAGAIMNGASLIKEALGGVEHRILVMPGKPDRGFEFVVPDGEYLVLGDNRDNSNDSRYWGTVSEKHLVGKAFLIWMSWDSVKSSVSWSRIGTVIN